MFEKVTKKSAIGLTLIAVCYALSLVSWGISFAIRDQYADPALAATQPNPLATVVGCLTPLLALAQLIGIILMVVDGKATGQPHRKLTWVGLILFILSGIMTIGIIPLSYSSVMSGDTGTYSLMTWVGAAIGILGSIAPVVLVFAISSPLLRVGLGLAVVLNAVNSLGSMFLTLSNLKMKEMVINGVRMYIPETSVLMGPTATALSICQGVGSLIFAVVFVLLMVKAWQFARQNEVPNESVA
jgi:hypothetical protein